METPVKQRLTQFIKYLGISQRQFEQSINVANGYVNNMIKGVSAERIATIKRVYPNLNTEWLMTGEGEMLTPATAPTEPTSLDKLLDIMQQDHRLLREQLGRKDETIDRLLSIMEADRNIERKKETA